MKKQSKAIGRILRACGVRDSRASRMIVADVLEMEATDIGNSNSGNYGHKGRPGQVGGSGGGGGSSSGSSSKKSKESGTSKSSNPRSGGTVTKNLPKGSGRTVVDRKDVELGNHSIKQYLNEDGELNPEREDLHQKIVDEFYEGRPKPGEGEERTFYMMGGGSASGKSTVLDDPSFGMPSEADVTRIDSDGIKTKFPEYQQMINSGQTDEAASFAHEESSALAKRALTAGIDNGYNVLLDGTGDGSEKSVKSKIQEARDAGMKVEACYVSCPTEEAVSRSLARAEKTGRQVPVDRIRSIHRDVSKIFPKVASEFDHVRLYDTRGSKGSKPVLMAECYRGQEVIVHNKQLYDEFLAKANE